MRSWAASEVSPRLRSVTGDFDESMPPPLIDIVAENYKFRLSARRNGRGDAEIPARAESKRLIPILSPWPHNRQTDRTAHFHPRQGDSIPRTAHVFDVEAATFEYNERILEHQQMSLNLSARLCNPPPRPRRAGTAQRSGTPRIGYESRITKPPGRTLPSRQPPKQKPEPVAISPDFLAGSLKISRVTTARRPKSVKHVIRGEVEGHENRPELVRDRKRFRSPPPRVNRPRNGRATAGSYTMNPEEQES
jgi:hypothetical protein